MNCPHCGKDLTVWISKPLEINTTISATNPSIMPGSFQVFSPA